MKHHYKDLTDKLGEPKWWDEVGVPRYCEFNPGENANIYADEVALVLIRCQNCGHEFKVCMSSKKYFETPLHEEIMDHSLSYGDPPNFGCCPAGPTMTSDNVKVLEFWYRSSDFEWVRAPYVEIEFPAYE